MKDLVAADAKPAEGIAGIIGSLYGTAVRSKNRYTLPQEHAFYTGYLAALDNVRAALPAPRAGQDDEG